MLSRRIRAFGLVVAIDTDDERLFALLDRRLPSFPREPEGAAADARYQLSSTRVPGRVFVLRGRRTIASTGDLASAADRLVADLQSVLGRLAPGCTFIHAGVVAFGKQVLLLPAHSGAGKTTLVASLLRAGATYGSDEFAVLDRGGCVHAYSRHLAQRTGDRFVEAARFGAATFAEPRRVSAVIFTHFSSQAAPGLRPLPPGETVLKLLEHCLGARERPAETLRTLRILARDAPGLSGARGEADAMAVELIARAREGWTAANPLSGS